MIICPNCKEEIEERSHFCDQCGQELVTADVLVKVAVVLIAVG